MMAYLSGADVDLDSVTARVLTSDNGSAATIAGKLTTGQPVSITVSQISGQNAHKILVLSADGHFELDLLSRDALRHDRPTNRLSLAERIEERGRRLVAAADIRGSRDPSFERALRHFVSLASGSEPASENRLPVSGGRKALALALAARASAEAANH